MSDKKPVVYLEDLEGPQVKAADSVSDKKANAKVVVASKTVTKTTQDASNKATVTKTSKKRQASLMDMFPGGSSQPSKKLRVENATSSITSATAESASGSKADQTLNSVPFSLSGYKESLSDEEKKLLSLECETMGKSWLKLLKDEIRKPYFLKLKQYLSDQGVKGVEDTAKSCKVYPAPQDIYSWSNLTPLGRVKVVIIGQDPYHGPRQAHGLSFSVPHGVPIPPSLRNIYKEIRNEYPEFAPPTHGNLTSWAQNGVLLLNTCLTVKANEAGSHSGKGWEDFTDKVVDVIDKYGGANLGAQGSSLAGRGRGIVFLAWGAWAAKRVAKLDKKRHLILKSAHPSPLSASRGFFGTGHFKEANEWLEAKYGAQGCVDWCTL